MDSYGLRNAYNKVSRVSQPIDLDPDVISSMGYVGLAIADLILIQTVLRAPLKPACAANISILSSGGDNKATGRSASGGGTCQN